MHNTNNIEKQHRAPNIRRSALSFVKTILVIHIIENEDSSIGNETRILGFMTIEISYVSVAGNFIL